jgi:hypothetical protein
MSDIFISYTSSDRPKARELGKRLEQEGWSVWWDRKIPPGQSFDKVIEEALNAARCVVVLWSTTSCLSDWVKNEAAEGNRRGILVPAFIEDTSLPFEFRRIQAANLVDWEKPSPGNELNQFLDAIRRVLGGEGPPENLAAGAHQEAGFENIPRTVIHTDLTGGDGVNPLWKRWGRLTLFALGMVLPTMGLFKALYPQTPVTEVLATIVILSVIAGAGLNFCWTRWRQAMVRRRGKK